MDKRGKLVLAIGVVLLFSAGGAAVVYLSDWKKRAELNAGDPLYGQLMAMFAAAESQYGIPTDLLARQGYEESKFRPDIISGATQSSAGAQGIMQFEPATAAQYGVTNPFDPSIAIPGAARYMAYLYNKFGSWSLALAAYDAGEGNVQTAGGIPPFPETQNYVSEILADVNAEGGPQVS